MTRLHSDHMAPSAQRLGRQDGGLVPCSRSKHHPHHPAMEDCMWCEPKKPAPVPLRTLGQAFWEHRNSDPYGTWEYLSDYWKEVYEADAKADRASYKFTYGKDTEPSWARGLDAADDIADLDTIPPPYGVYP